MLIRESISAYKHLDLDNIKLAFTQDLSARIVRVGEQFGEHFLAT